MNFFWSSQFFHKLLIDGEKLVKKNLHEKLEDLTTGLRLWSLLLVIKKKDFVKFCNCMVCEGTWIFCILLQTLCRKFCILEIQGGKEDKDAALKSLLVSSFVIIY